MLGFVVGRQARSCRTHPHPASLPRSRRGRASRGPLPPPPPLPPRSFSVSAEAAILLLPRAGVGGPSPLQVRPPAGPPPHGLRPLRTVSPRPPLSTPAVRSGCHFRRGAASGGGGGRPGLSVTGGAAGGRHLREGPQHHRPLWRSRARALAAQVQTQEGRTLLVHHSLFTTTVSDALSSRSVVISFAPPKLRLAPGHQALGAELGCSALHFVIEVLVYKSLLILRQLPILITSSHCLMIDRQAQCYTAGEWRFQLPFPRSFIIPN
jgi:hypothetical protein